MEILEDEGYMDQYRTLLLVGVTSGIMSNEITTAQALQYTNQHFDGADGVSGQVLPAGASGVPWGGVIDLETMTVTAMENNDQYIDFTYTTAALAMKNANDD
jgi:hypothetical protein